MDEWSMGDLEGGSGWFSDASDLPDLSDAEIRALRDQGLTTDTSVGGDSSFDWGGLFKSTLGFLGTAATVAIPAYFASTRPVQTYYGSNAPGGGYAFVSPSAPVRRGAAGAAPPVWNLGGGGIGAMFSNPLVLAAGVAGLLLFVLAARR
jgi:hypothetical protein